MTTRSQDSTGPALNMLGAIVPQCIRLDLKVRDKAGLLSLISEEAAAFTGLGQAAILSALRKREELGSTGVGRGIALPHAAIDGLESPFGLLARLDHAIDYGAIDDQPVDLVFLLLTPSRSASSDLTTLSAIARTLRLEDVLAAVREGSTEAEVRAAWGDAI